jgi:hypothetical protein
MKELHLLSSLGFSYGCIEVNALCISAFSCCNYVVAVCGDVRVKTNYLCEWSSYICLLIGKLKRHIIKLLFDVVTF